MVQKFWYKLTLLIQRVQRFCVCTCVCVCLCDYCQFRQVLRILNTSTVQWVQLHCHGNSRVLLTTTSLNITTQIHRQLTWPVSAVSMCQRQSVACRHLAPTTVSVSLLSADTCIVTRPRCVATQVSNLLQLLTLIVGHRERHLDT